MLLSVFGVAETATEPKLSRGPFADKLAAAAALACPLTDTKLSGQALFAKNIVQIYQRLHEAELLSKDGIGDQHTYLSVGVAMICAQKLNDQFLESPTKEYRLFAQSMKEDLAQRMEIYKDQFMVFITINGQQETSEDYREQVRLNFKRLNDNNLQLGEHFLSAEATAIKPKNKSFYLTKNEVTQIRELIQKTFGTPGDEKDKTFAKHLAEIMYSHLDQWKTKS
jgi:hypothetical protein